MKRILITLLLVLNIVPTQLMASSRTDEVITSSVEQQIKEITKLKKDLAEAQTKLVLLSKDLETAKSNHVGHEIFLKTRNVGAITMAGSVLYLLGRGFLPATMNEAMNVLVINTGVLVLGGTITIAGEVGVLLTSDEADKIRDQLKVLNKSMSAAEKSLKKEIETLCKIDPTIVTCQ